MSRKPSVFVTVGTTKFEELVSAVCSQGIVSSLHKLGYEKINVQFGAGEKPKVKVPGLVCFDFKENIETDMKNASLIITHAGAGSILEAVRVRKAKVVVVINDTLLDDHQSELAEEMHEKGYLLCCRVPQLKETLERIPDEVFIQFPAHEPHRFPEMLNNILGWK